MGNRVLLSILILSAWAGCGDDGGNTKPDATVSVDAPAVAPTCTDMIENGTETDVDCGGTCAPAALCAAGKGCAVPADCASGVCAADVCAAAVCGDAVLQPPEACDDGNTVNNDGCDDNCRPTGCGNGVIAGNEVCDDGNDVSGDGCDNNCTATACGNGLIAGAETCDDGNDAPFDGCGATCRIEPTEVEPNDTFAQASASAVQVTTSTLVRGSIPTAGDLDLYQVTVATATVLRLETFGSIVRDCDANLTVQLFDSGGVPIVADTVGSGIGSCGSLAWFVAAGTYFVQVAEEGLNETVATYYLAITYTTDRLAESEAANTSGVNDVFGTASTNLASGTDVYVFGDHTVETDFDVYSITVPAGARIRAEIVEGDRAVETCESNGIDSYLTLRDQTGAELATDNDDGRGSCSLIDGFGSAPDNPGARNATAVSQTYFVEVDTGSSMAAAQFSYRLVVTIY